MKFPKVIASHIIRSSKGGVHGGMYLVDISSGKFDCVLNWNDKINWGGRGANRGLRGICFYDKYTIVATSNSILFLDKNFKIKNTYTNSFLKSCHEMCVHDDILYITSTGYGLIVLFDLKRRKFLYAINFRNHNRCYRLNLIKRAPRFKDGLHINNVYVDSRGIFLSGTEMDNLVLIKHDLSKSWNYCKIPKGTHNCTPIGNRIIMNDTVANRVVIRNTRSSRDEQSFNIKKINNNKLKKIVGDKVAKQPFGRGLTFYKDFIIGGSSPGMISIYNTKTGRNEKDIIMTNDIRISIHGLELYYG
jgi:hypothetical protein